MGMSINIPSDSVGKGSAPVAAPSQQEAEQLVSQAYKGIGRSGFGGNVNQIDPEGYKYWTGRVTSGELSPDQFRGAFGEAVKNYVAQKPKDALSNYVQLASTNQPKFGSANQYAQMMPWDTPYQAGAWDQAQFGPTIAGYGLNQGQVQGKGKGAPSVPNVPFVAPTIFPVTQTSTTYGGGSSTTGGGGTSTSKNTSTGTSASDSTYTSGQNQY